MSVSVLTLPAAGWYPDPTGTSVYRWWNGETWTDGLHDGLDTETRSPLRLFADETVRPSAEPDDESFILPAEAFTASAPVAPEPAPEPEPPAPAPAPAPAPEVALPHEPVLLGPPIVTERAPDRREQLKTRWSSLLVAFPFVYPIAIAVVAGLAYAGGAASSIATVAVIAASAAVLLLIPAFVLAEQDRKELLARGVPHPPSLGWLLLLPPIAYLIARGRSTR